MLHKISEAFCTPGILRKTVDDVSIALSKELAVFPQTSFCPNIVIADCKQALSDSLRDDYTKPIKMVIL